MTWPNQVKSLLLTLIGLLLLGTLWLLMRLNGLVEESVAPPDLSRQPAQQPVEPTPVRLEARWLLAGEVFWGRRMEQIASQQAKPYEYLFSRLDSFGRNQYDVWLAHLECPVTDQTVPYSVQVSDLIFNCEPEYLKEFARYFDAVSLANNHTDNVDGVSGLLTTRQNLEKASIQYYGHFDNGVAEDICEIISLPVRIVMSDDSAQLKLLPVALCGYHNVFRLPTETELNQISRFSEHFFTIVSPQQGAEYQPSADAIKQNIYRRMVDKGADLVVASHPHWVQNTEVYKGKLIMYSVGNFMFDQEWSEETKRGVALDLRLGTEYTPELEQWLKLGEECREFKDDCFRRSPKDKLSLSLEFELVSSLHENGLTRQAPENIHQLNLKRTNWEATKKSLEQQN